MRRRPLIAAAALAAAVGVGVAGSVAAASAEGAAYDVRTEELTVTATPEPRGKQTVRVDLDVTLFLPRGAPRAPAVLLAHGFGSSKTDVEGRAKELSGRGYVVLTYTARGFGRSGGLIHLNAPRFEVADASRLLDVLAGRPEVLLDGPGDPRVGVAGGSYGGALALLLAGHDDRVDALIAQITWNDLGRALFPQFEVRDRVPGSPAGIDPVAAPGVFKKGWAGTFFSPGASATPSGSGNPTGDVAASACGRFSAQLCAAYQRVAATGRPDPRLFDLIDESSPARVLDRITAPTLLIQGQGDSLFPLSEADANARGIAANGTPVKVVWFSGGHDGGPGSDVEAGRLTALADAWLDRYLRRDGSPDDTRFEATVPRAAVSSSSGRATAQQRIAPGLPGVTAARPVTRTVPLTSAKPGRPGGGAGGRTGARSATDASQVVQAPAGAAPAAITTVPGLGPALGALVTGGAGASLSALPGQVAVFESAPLPEGLQIVGSSRVTVRVAGTGTDGTLFAQLLDVDPSGAAVLPSQLVAPVYLPTVGPAGRDVVLALPAIVRDVAAGHRLRLVISTTDQAFAMPAEPRRYLISLAPGGAGQLTVPGVPMAAVAADGASELWTWAGGLLLAALAASGTLRLLARRRRGGPPDPALSGVPLAVTGLGKAYDDGFRAVSDVSFRVEPGWVLGLLGPNGAGKTTVLRMLMGLIRPSEGSIRVFGHPVSAGAPVLSRVGCFVEGPGFLPHVSGVENLRLYWQATGRPPSDAHLDEALEIAGLGDDVHRRVSTYSQGMRQRLAIAQAMLGLPDLLVLDEPTNGLDPPQIREMREVLGRYAATGRTVVVSSHLLSEVEHTCSHVVIMHRGTLVAHGPVAELVGSASLLVVDVDDPARAAEVACGLAGAQEVTVTPTGLTLQLVGTPRGELVRLLVEAGLSVERVTSQRGLEEAFLALVGEV